MAVAFSPDGKTLAYASGVYEGGVWDKSEITFCDLTAGQELRSIARHQDMAYSLAFSPDGKMLASASLEPTLKLWDVTTGKQQQTLQTGVPTTCVAFSPDGKTLACSTHGGGVVQLWDLASGTEQAKFALGSPGLRIWQVAFSPDGRHLARARGNGTIYILRL